MKNIYQDIKFAVDNFYVISLLSIKLKSKSKFEYRVAKALINHYVKHELIKVVVGVNDTLYRTYIPFIDKY